MSTEPMASERIREMSMSFWPDCLSPASRLECVGDMIGEKWLRCSAETDLHSEFDLEFLDIVSSRKQRSLKDSLQISTPST